MKKINIFGLGIQSLSSTITSQRRVNCSYSIRNDGEKNKIVIIQTPGLTRLLTLPSSPIRGMWQNGEYAYVVAGASLYLLTATGFNFIGIFGSVSNPTTPVTMTTNSSQLAIVDGVNVYIFELSAIPGILTLSGQILTQLLPLLQIVNAQ